MGGRCSLDEVMNCCSTLCTSKAVGVMAQLKAGQGCNVAIGDCVGCHNVLTPASERHGLLVPVSTHTPAFSVFPSYIDGFALDR